MQSVRQALAVAPRRVRLSGRVLALALAASLALSGVLALALRDVAAPVRHRAAFTPTALIGGLPLQQARCQEWIGATPSERGAIVRALAGVVGGPSTSGGVGTTLSTARANALFDRVCASRVAQGFLLYEMYIRAAGFSSYR
ncbi:MAG TPA: hypothetical protein VF752_11590 [Thermoleophilaceae bacterium]